MNVGVTGHQYRTSIDWAWVKSSTRLEISKLPSVSRVFSSLASGSDQIAAEVAIELGIPVSAVIPLEGYERFFSGEDLMNYRRLLRRCMPIQLGWKGDAQRSFFEAGKFIVDRCETLIAIWDGEVAEGLGGTGDVVKYAMRRSHQIVHINPITEAIVRY